MVETQLCKLRGTSDTFAGRAYSIFHLYSGVIWFYPPREQRTRGKSRFFIGDVLVDFLPRVN